MITKEYKFCAAHKYWNADWNNKKNIKEFGDDTKLHGHNYDLLVTIAGPINTETGFVINLQTLNSVVNDHVIKLFDHSRIERDIEWFNDKQPSTENMVVFIWNQIVNHIHQPAYLYKIMLRETKSIFTEYYGE